MPAAASLSQGSALLMAIASEGAETVAGSAHAACALHAWRLRAALKHAISAVALRTWAPLTVEELAHLLPLSGAPVHPAHCHLIWDHLGDHNPELFH